MSKLLAKDDLLREVAMAAGVSKASAEAVLAAAGATIRRVTAEGYTVAMPQLGRFREKVLAARVGRNPQTGVPVDVPEKRVLRFTPSQTKA